VDWLLGYFESHRQGLAALPNVNEGNDPVTGAKAELMRKIKKKWLKLWQLTTLFWLGWAAKAVMELFSSVTGRELSGSIPEEKFGDWRSSF
jgi:hypothetical protein